MAPVARALRANPTSAERRLWQGLRRKHIAGFRFRRQVVLAGYVVDFVSLDAKLIIGVDGATHSTDEEIARDRSRSNTLAGQGFAVMRFSNHDVSNSLDGVLEAIRAKLMVLRPRIEELPS